MDVCLVQVPFAAISRPSLGLSLVKSNLEREGVSAEVVYSNIAFAELLGLDVYGLIEMSSPDVLFGEWIFSHAAFPDFEPDDDRFLDSLRHSVFSSETARWLKLWYPHLDLKHLARSVRDRVDTFLDELVASILERQPRMVGCTSMFQQHCASLALLRRVKASDPEVITLLGGPNCEGTMGRTTHRAFPWLDFVFSGETDSFVGSFCKTVLEEGIELSTSQLPTGVWAPAHRGAGPSAETLPRGSQGLVTLTSRPEVTDPDAYAGVVHDLDSLPAPSYDEYFASLESSILAPFVGPAIPLESSRGCWWGQHQHCTFCGLNGMGMTYRSKSAEVVLGEIRHLCERHRVREVEFADNILGMENLKTLIPALASKNGVSKNGASSGGENGTDSFNIFFEIKANLKRHHLRSLSEAGVRWIQPGIESLHPEILERLKKGVSPLQNIQLLRWSRELGTYVYYTLLFGLPDDADQWYSEMAEWAPKLTHLQPPFATSRIRFDRFSPYHGEASDFDLDLAPKRQYGYVYPLPKRDLASIAYYFEDYSKARRGVAVGEDGNTQEGLRDFLAAITAWRHLWFDPRLPEPPSLTFVDDGEVLTLTDRRPLAQQLASDETGEDATTLVLAGLDRQLYLLCDAIQSLPALARRLKHEAGPEDIEARLDRWIDRGVLLESGGRYLSLAVAADCRPYPVGQGAPLAQVDYLSYFRVTGRRPFVLRSCSS